MRDSRIILAAAVVLAAFSSCSDNVRIDGTVSGAPESEIVVKRLAGSTLDVMDTLKTDSNGAYSYRMGVEEGQPEFVYLYSGDTRVASLLLRKGDKVNVTSDLQGNYDVEGSEESAKLRQIEMDYSAFMKDFEAASLEEDSKTASKLYVDYYRSRVKYVLENTGSLTVIPVLYQKINDNFPVFSQNTDAVIFKAVHDSLEKVYPDSRYVAALARETQARQNALSVEQKIMNAVESGYPDVELPSVDGKKVRLGEIGSKAILVHFWEASDPVQKMFNQDVLLPLYETFHSKGLEIYSISLDTDKGVWASAVKNQKLPWINVCDGLGAATQAVSLYNVSGDLPVGYLIVDGQLIPEVVSSENDARRIIASYLK